MLEPTFYATGRDERGQDHKYTVSTQDPAPEGHIIIDLKVARVVRLSDLIDRETAEKLFTLSGQKNINRYVLI